MKNILKDLILKSKDEIFIFDSINQKNFTYSEFFNLSLLYYQYIIKNKKENIKIAVLLDNSIDLLAIYIACLLSRNIVIPIDIQGGKDYINDILNRYQFDIVIDRYISYTKIDNINILELIEKIDFNKPFIITHTSGTSGKSKGVIHSFSNLYRSAKSFADKHHYNDNSIFYHNLPMTYMAGILNQFIMPFISKSKIVLGKRFNIREILNFWEIPVKYQCNVFWLNPTIISLLNQMDRSNIGIDYLKKNNITISVGTAPLFENVKNIFENKYHTKLYRSYGLSETLFITTQYNMLNNIECSNGEILDNVIVNIEKNQEITITAPWNFLGYANDDKQESVFHTGDTGYISNNQLFITGRIKDLIIRGGMNISPTLLENTLMTLNIFDEIAVIGYEDNILTEKIVCYYVCKTNIDIEQINSHIINSLGNNYKIDEYIKIDELPKNSNNKINKIRLKEIYANRD